MLAQTDYFIIAILSLAALVRGAVGFADALLAMPLMLMMLPTSVAAPLMATASILIALIMLGKEWRVVDWSVSLRLIIPSLLVIRVGIWIGGTASIPIARATLGVLLVSFSAWSLSRAALPKFETDRHAPWFGVAAGILGGAFNTGGPPLVIYSALRRWSPQEFRATMQAYAVSGSISILSMHAWVGNVTSDTVRWFLLAAPCVVIATLIGQRLNLKMSTDRFARLTHVLLVGLGGLLLLTSLRG